MLIIQMFVLGGNQTELLPLSCEAFKNIGKCTVRYLLSADLKIFRWTNSNSNWATQIVNKYVKDKVTPAFTSVCHIDLQTLVCF